MKKFLIAAVAIGALSSGPTLAADMPVKAAVLTPAVSWTGCYFGGNLGGAWKNYSSSNPTSGILLVDHTVEGFVGGGQIGCDYQLNNNWVMGIQAMWDGSGVHGSSTPFPALDFADLISVRVNSFGTVAAKFGYLVNPSLQLYGKTGIGWVAEKSTYFCSPLDCAVPGSPSVSWTRSGFDAGVGLTWMFRRNWDLFVEYDHMWLGTKSITYSPWDGGTLTENVRQAFDKVLVGIDYRFDWGKDPVVAKY